MKRAGTARSAFLDGGAARDEGVRSHRPGDDGSRGDICAFSNLDAWNDHRAGCDERILPASHRAGKVRAGGDLDIVFYDIVMIDRCAGVDDREAADTDAGIDNRARHDHRSFAQAYVARDDRARMYEHREFAARGAYRFSQTPPCRGIAYSDHEAVAARECREQFKRWSIHGQIRRGIDRFVIEEGHRVFAHRACDIGDNTAMSSTADNLEGALTGHILTPLKVMPITVNIRIVARRINKKSTFPMGYCNWSNRNETHA